MQGMLEPCQTTLGRVFRRIPRPVKLAFCASFLAGMLVYLYALTNSFVCVGDALTNIVYNGNLVWMGRWSMQWLTLLGTDLSMPLVNGMLMITAISLLSAMAVWYLEIKSSLCAVLAALTLMCHPTVGDTLEYLPFVDGFMIASMLAMLSLLVTDRFRFGFLAGIPLLTVAIGGYQAQASLVIALMLVRGIMLLARGEETNKRLIMLILRYVLYVAAALGLYYVLAGVLARASGIPLSDYRSVNTMGQFSLDTLLNNFLLCYADFKKSITFLSFRPSYYVSGYPNYLLVLLTLCLVAVRFIVRKRVTVFQAILLVVLLALSPMLLCSIRMFNPGTVYSLMTYSTVGLYLLAACLMDDLPSALLAVRDTSLRLFRAVPVKRLLRALMCAASWLLLLCLIVAFVVWSVGANIDFFEAKLDYENMYAQCSEYLSVAEAVEGYERGMPIYVIGSAGAGDTSRTTPALSLPKYYYAFMVHYLNVQMPYGIANAVDDAAREIAAGQAFAEMPCYPDVGSARVLDGAMVVKLSQVENAAAQ